MGTPWERLTGIGKPFLVSVLNGTLGKGKLFYTEDGTNFFLIVATVPDGAITTAKIANLAVTDAKIAGMAYSKLTGAPTSFPPSGAAGGDLTGTYPNPEIAAGAVGTNELAADAVTAAKIVAGAVGTSEIADGAVTNDKVANGIDYGKLTNAPITMIPSGPAGGDLSGTYPNPGVARIQGWSVYTGTAPSAGWVLTWDGTNNRITWAAAGGGYTDEQAVDAVAAAEALGDGFGNVASFYLDGSNALGHYVKTGGIGSNELAPNAVTAAKLNNLAVTTAALANAAVTLAKMAVDSVGTDQIVDTAVTWQKIQGVSDSPRWLGRYTGGSGTVQEGTFGDSLGVDEATGELNVMNYRGAILWVPLAGGFIVPAGATRYVGPFRATVATDATLVRWNPIRDGLARKFSIESNGTQPGDGTFVATVQKDYSDTTLQIVIAAGDPGGNLIDTEHEVLWGIGEDMVIAFTNNSLTGAAIQVTDIFLGFD
jgi:hypothetical protein